MKPIKFISVAIAAISASTSAAAWADDLDETTLTLADDAAQDQRVATPVTGADMQIPVTADTATAVTLPDTGWPAVVNAAAANLVSDDMLSQQRGTATITVGNQTLAAINSGNTINGDFTAGAINLTDNALSSFNGFGNLVINTGAQNNLQSGMNVTLNFAN
jgi:hypothetical protein